MIEGLLVEHGFELIVTVVQTLVVTIGYAIGSSRLLSRSDISKLPAELEGLYDRIRRKWALKAISQSNIVDR